MRLVWQDHNVNPPAPTSNFQSSPKPKATLRRELAVAAGILPAVEPWLPARRNGRPESKRVEILTSCGRAEVFSGRQDAVRYVRQGCLTPPRNNTRRRFEAWGLKFLWLLLLGVWSFCLSASAAQKNILLLIADDYGVDSSSLYNSTNTGASLPPTPNIASLATNGVVFTRFYANPVCSPSRACLLTGQYGFRTGVGDVVGAGVTLTTNAFTLPMAFTNAATGYALSQFGKWHLAPAAQVNAPRTVGRWTNYLGSLDGQVTNYYTWTKTTNGASFTSTNYATTDLVNDATNWIAARGTNAWFVWAAFNAPHTPFHKPPTNLAPHYASLSGTTADINSNPRPYFEAMVEAMDTEIGRLLSVVNRTNTHIIFLGDNGTLRDVLQPPFPSTRGKDTLYEGGTHVPLIISGPAVVNPNRTNATLSGVVDLFATILEMAGTSVSAAVPTNVPVDGQSLLAALTGTNVLARYAYSELFGANVVPASAAGRTLRNSQFKLISFTDGHNEFYDLLGDPYEKTNLQNSALNAAQLGNYYSLTMKLGDYQIALTPPVITRVAKTNAQFLVTVQRNLTNSYGLWRAGSLDALAWSPLTNAVAITNGAASVTLTDTNASASQNFYRVMAQ